MGDQYRRAASEDHIVWQPFRPHARIIIKLGGGTATRGGEELKSLGRLEKKRLGKIPIYKIEVRSISTGHPSIFEGHVGLPIFVNVWVGRSAFVEVVLLDLL